MPTCEYNPKHSFNEARSGPHRKLLFPDGRKLDWYGVCRACLNTQQAWEREQTVARMAEAKRKQEWHRQVAERDMARREQIAANAHARDMAKIARLESELEALRKKISDTHLTK